MTLTLHFQKKIVRYPLFTANVPRRDVDIGLSQTPEFLLILSRYLLSSSIEIHVSAPLLAWWCDAWLGIGLATKSFRSR